MKKCTCKDCFWKHTIPFFGSWYACLLNQNNKERESTKDNFKPCRGFEKDKLN